MAKLIAVDLGTTLVKCTLFEEDGRTLATESLPGHLVYPTPEQAEQDAELWYADVCETISRLTAAYDPADIRGISISSQGISVVPVDEQFHPLRPAISWLDRRTDNECKELTAQRSPEEWFRRTGKFPGGWTLAKILWFRNHEPEIFHSASKFLLPMDYVNARMTGNAVTEHTLASGTLCLNLNLDQWDPEILEENGLRPEQLAEIRPAGALVGPINEETIRRTGLCPGTLVFNGGQDQKVAAFAAEITSECASLSLGTAGAMEVFVEDPTAQDTLPVFPYIASDKTLVEICINTTGAAIQWFKDTLAPDLSFDDLNRLAEQAPIGSKGVHFYPHLAGPGSPHKNKSFMGSIQEISLSVNRGDLFRSLFEGLAYEIRLNLECARKAGSNLQQLVLFGGASKSEIFCQIISDVTNLEIFATKNGEFGSIGAAKLAALGLGLDASGFASGAIGEKRRYSPNPSAVAQYDALYQKYIEIYKSEA